MLRTLSIFPPAVYLLKYVWRLLSNLPFSQPFLRRLCKGILLGGLGAYILLAAPSYSYDVFAQTIVPVEVETDDHLKKANKALSGRLGGGLQVEVAQTTNATNANVKKKWVTRALTEEIIETSMLERGDMLTGQTRMANNEMVTFRLRILSIMHNATPETDSILALIEDDLFVKTGVLAGMSGSPVYYQGKLVGAVAFTVAFLKQPIVGITPITAMLRIIDYQDKQTALEKAGQQSGQKNAFIPRYVAQETNHALTPFQRTYQQKSQPFKLLQGQETAVTSPYLQGLEGLNTYSGLREASAASYQLQHAMKKRGLQPIATPLAVSGAFYLNDDMLQRIGSWQHVLVTSGGGVGVPYSVAQSSHTSKQADAGLAAENGGAAKNFITTPRSFAQLVPGDLIGVNLVRGSLNISAFGTITYKDDDYLLAFGHPMGLLGATDLAMYVGFVDAVVPRLDFSYKVGRLMNEIGAFKQDRSPGILGVKDALTPRLPIHVTIETPLVEEQLNFEVIHTRPFIEQMTALVLYNSFLQFEGLGEESTFQYELQIKHANGKELQLQRTLLYGFKQRNLLLLLDYFNNLMQLVLDNQFAPPRLASIALKLKSQPEQRFAVLEQVTYPREDYLAGQKIPFTLRYRSYQGKTQYKKLSYTLPAKLAAGDYRIQLANESTFMQQDFLRNAARYVPYDLDTLFALLSLSPNIAKLVIWSTPPAGQAVKLKNKQTYPNLPGTKQALLLTLPQTGTRTLQEVVKEGVIFPEALVGELSFPIKVRLP